MSPQCECMVEIPLSQGCKAKLNFNYPVRPVTNIYNSAAPLYSLETKSQDLMIEKR